MRKLLILTILLVLSAGAFGQEAFYSIFSYDSFIPDVRVEHRSVELQAQLYPEHYAMYSAAADLRWTRDNDSALAAFWESRGDTILHVLTELGGIEWREPVFDIHMLRYFPSAGAPDPLIIPVGGMKRGALIEAAPTGKVQQFNLMYQLAHRLLNQTVQPRYGDDIAVAYHPLMRHSAYRRDNVAMLLAVATAENVLGLDSARDAWQSAFWRNHFPGYDVFNRFFVNEWILTPDRTLADWFTSEPYGSHLVAATRPPRRPNRNAEPQPQTFIEGLPLKGDLGMAVSIDENGLLRVDTLDQYRVAYASGLRRGDRIRTVNGSRVRTHKQLVEKILETLYDGGATLQVMREGDIRTVILQPLAVLPPDEEGYYYDEYYQFEDSAAVDTVDSGRSGFPQPD